MSKDYCKYCFAETVSVKNVYTVTQSYLVEPRIVEDVGTTFVNNARTGNRGGETPRSDEFGS
jgi:hypothetical protein